MSLLNKIRGAISDGHRCATPSLRLLLRSLVAHCVGSVPSSITDAEMAVAIMESHDNAVRRAEHAESELRALLAVELGAEPPADMRVTAEMIMRQRLKTKAAQG